MVKLCKKCKKIKDVNEFHKDKALKDGYKNICKICENNRYKHICEFCKKEFSSSKKYQKYCSSKCVSNSQQKRIVTYCDYCGKEIQVIKCIYEKNKHNYCSQSCKNKGHSNEVSNMNNGRYNSKTIKCDYCGEEIIRKVSKIKDRNFCNNKCYSEYRKIHYSKENHSCWNPSITDEERLNKRKCEEYYNWRDSVFTRDNYTCVCCGKDTHHNNAHHLNGYDWDKQNRTNVDNGVTLCVDCHKDFHKTYGYGNNTKEQFNIWILSKKRNAS
ncbi:hypothetical protein LI014_06110 [Clostridium perfringens]|uniref:hypothetical protein n=1 Tax=Clostridium perfringens TaxID=1502 RepID=UPI002245AFD6|nr:hypothetical protein [Clostridium perfringens]MCX0396945.1 hypothetical protein [Clostridium perfringens]